MKILLTNYHTRAKTTYYRPGCFGRELARRGHEVTILCTSDAVRVGFTTQVQDGVRYVEAPDLLWGRLRTGWDLWNMANRCVALRNESFNLVHSFETRPATIHPVRGYIRRKPTPLVIDWIDWWGRGGLISEHRPLWYRLLFARFETFYEEHFRTMADASTVISRALGERACKLGVAKDSVFWIPNGCPVKDFPVVPPATHRKEYSLPVDALILADSAMDVTLGIEKTLAAVGRIAARRPEVLFLMTGGKEREFLRVAKRCGVADHVRHLGKFSYEELPRALSCADIFLMAYPDCVANRGRWPGRLGSYLALGRPVVSNPVGEVRRLFESERCGHLVDCTPEAMERGVLDLLEDGGMSADIAARGRKVAEQMTWSAMTDRLETCYTFAVDRFSSDRRRAQVAVVGIGKSVAVNGTRTFNVLGTRVCATDLETACATVCEWVRGSGRAKYVCVTSVHGIIEGVRSPVTRRIHNRADLCVPDGMPLTWIGRRESGRHVGRVYGPDLMLAVLAEAEKEGWKNYFYGGHPAVLPLLQAKVIERFPRLHIVGAHSPPFRDLTAEEDIAMVKSISEASPDLLWIGISTPRQEQLMATWADRVKVKVMLGVGAAFDFHAGSKRQAPNWMRDAGLEWLFRMFQEPRRLGPRYMRIIPAFMAHRFLQKTRLRNYPTE